MVKLPDPNTLPLFQYYDPATDSLQDITYPDGSQPRRIDNYVLDPADWKPANRTYSLRSSSSRRAACLPGTGTARTTRAAVLALGVDDDEPCCVCGREGTRCFGDSCVRSFRRRTQGAARVGRLRIERTAESIIEGDAAAADLGYGVFAGAMIRRGVVVGEYVGRLHPLDGARRLQGDHSYVFELEGMAKVDARDYGSVG